MAGDWIKTEHTLPDKPEIIRMAAMLDIDQDAVTGKLLRIWIWADQNSVSGEGIPVTCAFLDRLVDCKGFSAAMGAVSCSPSFIIPCQRTSGLQSDKRTGWKKFLLKSMSVSRNIVT